MRIHARRAAISLLVLALACALAGPLACSSKNESSSAGGAGKIKLLLMDTGIEESNQQMWRAAIAKFEAAHPEATVELRAHKDDDYSQGGLLMAALRSSNPPDVYYEWSWAAVERDAKGGNALDLAPYITPEFRQIIHPLAWAGTESGGKQMLIPFSYDIANIVFYKKKALADAGISPPATWEEFVEACRKLKAAGVQPIFQGNQGAWPAGNWASELAARYLGIERYRQAGEKPPRVPLTDAAFVEALTRLDELRAAGAFNADINTLNDNEGLAQFLAGDAAFIFAGSWILDYLTENGGEKTFGILPPLALPGAPPENRYLLANSAGYMIHARTQHPKLAFALLESLLSSEVQRLRIKYGLNTANVEVQKEIALPLQVEVQDLLKNSNQWVAAPDISWNRFTAERFYEAVKQVVGGTADPKTALEAAARDVEQAPQ